jgi:hypothetical protein
MSVEESAAVAALPVASVADPEVSAKAAMERAEKAAEEYEARRDKARGQEPAETETPKPRRGRPPKAPAAKVEPVKEAVESPEPEPEEDAPDKDREAALADLKAKARKLGLTIEDGVVAVGERVAFRQERRDKLAALERQEQEITARYEAGVAKLEEKYGPVLEKAKIIESGDPDGIAKMLGYKSFGEWSMEYVHNQNNPERKKMRELEGRLEAERQERERERSEAQAHQQTAAQRAAEERYREHLAAELAEDPEVSDLAGDKQFLDQVILVQKQHWNPKTKGTISSSDAAQIVVDKAYQAYLALHKRFGDQAPPPEKQPATRVIGEQQAQTQRRPPKTVSQSASADASGSRQYSEEDPAAFDREWKRRTAEALRNSTS